VESVTPEWDRAVPETFTATLTRSPWYMAWYQTFPPKQIAAVIARQDGRLVGLLPMSRIRTDARGLFFCQATNFARGDYQPPVISSDADPEVLPRLLDASFIGSRAFPRSTSPRESCRLICHPEAWRSWSRSSRLRG
jgi:hypothetical protein